MTIYHGTILVVDDNETIREPLAVLLELQGHRVVAARNGREALQRLNEESFDLVLLDIMMPEMDGYEVLNNMKTTGLLHQVPVVMISAVDNMDSVTRCIKLGAVDYLLKPFSRTLLEARVEASLEKKRWLDQEQAYLRQIEIEQEKSERLLLNILPEPITQRLKQGEKVIADSFPDVTVLFADLVDFTQQASRVSPSEIVQLLNDVFTTFDELAGKYGLEKIKTIGDAYMAVAGLPRPRPDHPSAAAEMALAMRAAVGHFSLSSPNPLQIRIGIATGPVVAGVIGRRKFAYDLWGDTVNTASRMQSEGLINAIQVSESTYQRLQDLYILEARGVIPVKGKGETPAYILKGRRRPVHISVSSAPTQPLNIDELVAR